MHETYFSIFGFMKRRLSMYVLHHMTADRIMRLKFNFDKFSGLDDALD